MKNKKRKSLFALIALVILSGVSAVSGTYAYWNLLTKTENATVNIGEGLETVVAVNATAPAGKTLVPAGTVTDAATQVTSIDLTFDVKLSKAVSVALPFEVVADNVLIGGSATYASLVNIAITGVPETLKDTTVHTVTVTVTLTEPGDETIYNAVKNKPITFTLTFTVSQL